MLSMANRASDGKVGKQALRAAVSETQLLARLSQALGIGLALAVLGGVLAWSMFNLRSHTRAQIANRDGEAFDALAAMQHLDDTSSGETIAPLTDPGEQIQLVLKISRLKNVIGVRLFSPDGEFVNAFPAFIEEARLSAETLARLRGLQPVSHYLPRARLEEHDLLAQTNGARVALLEINIPLHEEGETRLAGVAQFLVNGSSIAREYSQLDRRLALQAALAFAVGGSLLVTGLVVAFHRVRRANRLLAERTANLLQANRELTLAAKTSAVGAVTSHLIHGLKNPLSGLRGFVQDHAAAVGSHPNDDWEVAMATTERMGRLINQVVRVIQEGETHADYEISLSELMEMLTAKMEPLARAAGIRFQADLKAAGTLSNHQVNLILLILENLIQNAFDATPAGRVVRLRVFTQEDCLRMEVEDQGDGLPIEMQDRLFAPCPSSKKGGSGIGLAISRQLARHLGGELELGRSSPQGCVFRLVLPASLGRAGVSKTENAGSRVSLRNPL